MKKIAELLVCFIHPVAVVLIWLNLVVRPELSGTAKIVWAILALVPVVPFVYVLTGGELWERSEKPDVLPPLLPGSNKGRGKWAILHAICLLSVCATRMRWKCKREN